MATGNNPEQLAHRGGLKAPGVIATCSCGETLPMFRATVPAEFRALLPAEE